MSTLISKNFETVAPSEADALLARESSRLLATRKLGASATIRLCLEDGEAGEAIVVPTSAVRLFMHLLTEMSQGNSVCLIPIQAELTTQQAADLLNVSRPYLVKLLDEGKIPSRMVGKFRRVRFDDLMAYKKQDYEARLKILEELSALDQELGLGY